jgi:hypothetical protein
MIIVELWKGLELLLASACVICLTLSSVLDMEWDAVCICLILVLFHVDWIMEQDGNSRERKL